MSASTSSRVSVNLESTLYLEFPATITWLVLVKDFLGISGFTNTGAFVSLFSTMSKVSAGVILQHGIR